MNIKVKKATFFYGKRCIFNNINFELNEGEMLTILGPNGVGKTTLIKCLLGFSQLNQGNIFFDNKLYKDINKKIFWKKISYVPQIKEFNFSYDVKSMIMLGRNPYIGFMKMPEKNDYYEVEKIIELFNLEKIKNKSMNNLSGGEKQMVLIARAMVSNPEMMIIDEPELNLDISNQDKIFKILNKLIKNKKVSCIINTHNPINVIKYSDLSILMKKDLSYYYGKTNEVLNIDNITDVFELSKDYFKKIKDKMFLEV